MGPNGPPGPRIIVRRSNASRPGSRSLLLIRRRHPTQRRSAHPLPVKGSSSDRTDLLIAGHARSQGLIVVTGNLKEFTRVEGLRAEDWPSAQRS